MCPAVNIAEQNHQPSSAQDCKEFAGGTKSIRTAYYNTGSLHTSST